MAWEKVPSENHPVFRAALPSDPRVETMEMFGGVAAKVHGNVFAGLFGRSIMLLLPEADREAALKLEGAGFFDPMGDGRMRSNKIMLPEGMLKDPAELRRWIARAFQAAALLPEKGAKAKAPRAASKPAVTPAKKPSAGAKKTAKAVAPVKAVSPAKKKAAPVKAVSPAKKKAAPPKAVAPAKKKAAKKKKTAPLKKR